MENVHCRFLSSTTRLDRHKQLTLLAAHGTAHTDRQRAKQKQPVVQLSHAKSDTEI